MFPSSRYQFAIGTADAAGRLFLSTPDPFPYQPLPDNIPHVVQSGDTLWALAGRYYADEPRGCGYWWAIARFQPTPVAFDPTIMLSAGSIVVIPSLLTLRSKILNARRRRSAT